MIRVWLRVMIWVRVTARVSVTGRVTVSKVLGLGQIKVCNLLRLGLE